MINLVILTGEYPPQAGGVSDHTKLLACGLTEKGKRVTVIAPRISAESVAEKHFDVIRLPDHFGKKGRKVLESYLQECKEKNSRCRLLVQYTPHAFGLKGMNYPFVRWLAKRSPISPWVYFHEVTFPIQKGQSYKHWILALVQRYMARELVQAAEKIFVTIPRWTEVLSEIVKKEVNAEWIPVPSNLPTEFDAREVERIRNKFRQNCRYLIGHFGTYGAFTKNSLVAILRQLKVRNLDCRMILLGRGGLEFLDYLRENDIDEQQAIGIGELPPNELASYIAACDTMIQPYEDGVSGRRGSVMAALGIGSSIITSKGPATEPLWSQSKGVVLLPNGNWEKWVVKIESMLSSPDRMKEMRRHSNAFYDKEFSISKTLDRMIHHI